MTQLEAQSVLARMTAAFPQMPMTAPTARVWLEHLREMQFETATEAVRLIERSDERFPSLGRFRDTCRAVARRRANDTADERGVPENTNDPETPAEVGIERLRDIRANLKRRAS